jgi:hypothetical protein
LPGGGGELRVHAVAKPLVASYEAFAGVMAVPFVEVSRAEVGVWGSASDQRVDDHQAEMSYRHERSLDAAAGS